MLYFTTIIQNKIAPATVCKLTTSLQCQAWPTQSPLPVSVFTNMHIAVVSPHSCTHSLLALPIHKCLQLATTMHIPASSPCHFLAPTPEDVPHSRTIAHSNCTQLYIQLAPTHITWSQPTPVLGYPSTPTAGSRGTTKDPISSQSNCCPLSCCLNPSQLLMSQTSAAMPLGALLIPALGAHIQLELTQQCIHIPLKWYSCTCLVHRWRSFLTEANL